MQKSANICGRETCDLCHPDLVFHLRSWPVLTYDNARGHLRPWRITLYAESFLHASAAQCCRPSEDAMSQNQNPNPNQKPGQGGQQSDQDKKNPQHQQDQQRDCY